MLVGAIALSINNIRNPFNNALYSKTLVFTKLMDSGVVVMGMDLFTDECQSQYRNVSPVSCESIDVHWPLRNCRIGSLQMVLRHHANLTSSVREYRWDFNYRESRGHKLCSIAWLTNRRCLDALLHM